jgi:hypothetical protein
MRTKQLTIRLTSDFHKALVDYCTTNMIPVSTFMVQQTAKAIGYKPKPATSRSYSTGTTPVSAVEPEYGDINPDEYDWDMEDLQRRAAAAPLKRL